MQGFGDVVQRIREIAESPDTTAEQLASALQMDPILTARVLRLANSAYYTAGRQRITNLKQAVVTLGFKSVRELTLTANVLGVVDQTESAGEMPMDRFWTHSIACGLATPILAARLTGSRNDDYFIAGFLHDIAKPVLWNKFPDKWREVVHAMERNVDPLRAEREVFGLNHAEIGAWLLRMWRFPSEYFLAVGTHHTEGKNSGELGLAVAQANLIAAMVMETFPFSHRNRQVSETRLQRLGLSIEAIRELVEDIRWEVANIAKTFELPVVKLVDEAASQGDEGGLNEAKKAEPLSGGEAKETGGGEDVAAS